MLGRAQPQCMQHLLVHAQYVPMQRIERSNGPRGETVNHFQTQLRIVEATEDAAAALVPRSNARNFLELGMDRPYRLFQ